jgi:FAD/FMN-containing dehydrogenase
MPHYNRVRAASDAGLIAAWELVSSQPRVSPPAASPAPQLHSRTASHFIEASVSLRQTHASLVAGVRKIAERVQADAQLTALIRKKFAIKCTTGYSLNALVDFPTSDPLEIIKRLMIGSEGTLAFVSRATYNTVPEYNHKVSPLHVDSTTHIVLLRCYSTQCTDIPQHTGAHHPI